MIFNNPVRTLASATLLALAIAGVSTSFVHATAHDTQRACVEAGYFWDYYRNTCADKICRDQNGQTYTHGQRRPDVQSGHVTITSYCDGVTGQWYYYYHYQN